MGLQQKISAQNTDGTQDVVLNARFGNRVDIKGRYMIVSAAERDNGGDSDVGAAYIYYRTGNVWSIQQRIMPNVPIVNDKFGNSVLSPDKIYCCVSARDGGKGYIFKRTGTTWTQQDIIEPETPIADSKFGFEIVYDGENIIIGANGLTASDNDASEGRVYVYKQTNTNEDGNGVLSVDDHTTHELYLDGEKQKLSVDYSFANDSTLTTTSTVTTNTVVEHSIDGWRKIYETGREFNCILIKGKYLGYGGQIEFRDKENIMENPDGYEVKQVIYTNNNPLIPSNKF